MGTLLVCCGYVVGTLWVCCGDVVGTVYVSFHTFSNSNTHNVYACSDMCVQISDKLTLANDFGKWYLGLTDVTEEYKLHFLAMIECMQDMQMKVWDRTAAPTIQAKLKQAMANLEILLPHYWNTQVRHMLLCRFLRQLNKWGSFWSQSLLVIEMYHMLIKACGRSRKNLLVSFLNNYQLFDVSQLEWRFDDQDLAHIAVPSSLSRCLPKDHDQSEDNVIDLGRRKVVKIDLGDTTYMRILEMYGQYNNELNLLVQKFREHCDDHEFIHLDKWEASKGTLTKKEIKLQKTILPLCTMTQKITRAKLGPAFFCTAEYQKDKKNNNQWIMNRFKIKRRGKMVVETAYGLIQRMYRHRLTAGEPAFFVDCLWYVSCGKGANGLEQASYAPQYEKFPLAFLDMCVAVNFLLLPSSPFDFDFDDLAQYKNKKLRWDIIYK